MIENEEIIKVAFDLYKRYYLRAVLLEIFGKNNPTNSNSEIKEWLLSEVQKVDEICHSVTMSDIMPEYEYLIKIGYFDMVENNTKITLSKQGMKALQECTWESLASTAFLGHKGLYISNKSLEVSNNSFKIAKSALCYSKIACWITGFAVLASLASFVLALCK
jgi:hypothetical protein